MAKTTTVTSTRTREPAHFFLSLWGAVNELCRLVPPRDRAVILKMQKEDIQKDNSELQKGDPRQWDLFAGKGKTLLSRPRVITWENIRTSVILPTLLKVIEKGELRIYAEDPLRKQTKKLKRKTFAHARIDSGLPLQNKAKIRSRDGTVIYEDIKILRNDLPRIIAKHLKPHKITNPNWHAEKAALLRRLEEWLEKFIADDRAYHEGLREKAEPHTKEWILDRARHEVSLAVTMGMVRRVWKLTPSEWRRPGRRIK